MRQPAAAEELKVEVDWNAFLARQDAVWERLPQQWWEAPFLGNDMMGTMVRQTGQQALRWDVGRCDVQEHRDPNKVLID